MEVYTLNSNFLRENVIDDFKSIIWTERYLSAGDFVLTLKATPQAVSVLAIDKFLSIGGTNEVMLIDTNEVKDNILTVKGQSLLAFLENRAIRVTGAAGAPDTADKTTWKITGKTIGQVISHIVNKMLINDSDLNGLSFYDFDTEVGAVNRELISNLSLGPVDGSGAVIETSVNFSDSIYKVIKSLAEQYNIGISLYLDSASESGYSLKFKTYVGVDRSETVRFSPYTDSLTDITEFQSNAGYKNIIYGFSTNQDDRGIYLTPVVVSVAPGSVDSLTDFARRTLTLYFQTTVDPAVFTTSPAFENEVRRQLKIFLQDALVNNNFTKLVDGEVVPQPDFQFGTHYNLGDIIALEGFSGASQNARITEYIRAQDVSGYREYPTVSVVD